MREHFLIAQSANSHLAKFRHAGAMMLLQQDASALEAVPRILTIRRGLAIDPRSQMIAARDDAQREPLAVAGARLGRARPRNAEVVDAAGVVLRIVVVTLHFVAGRKLLRSIQV